MGWGLVVPFSRKRLSWRQPLIYCFLPLHNGTLEFAENE